MLIYLKQKVLNYFLAHVLQSKAALINLHKLPNSLLKQFYKVLSNVHSNS